MDRPGEIGWADFERVELRVGTVVAVGDFPQAKKPAYKLTIDFGPEVGVRRSSAQITALYAKDELVGRQVVAVVNFPPKQVANFFSEVLVTGFVQPDGAIVLAVPERPVPDGTRLA
ncbi:MAG: tRNA-binding protein [Gemmataceae bacterium]|nr:tRNA-binding protein [Gemmataceae bacterium]